MAESFDYIVVGAPLQGVLIALSVAAGDPVRSGDPLATIEAMKIEMVVRAPCNGRVADISLPIGAEVAANDLLMVIEPTEPPTSDGSRLTK
jgi:biotin carboxyl carrier protein